MYHIVGTDLFASKENTTRSHVNALTLARFSACEWLDCMRGVSGPGLGFCCCAKVEWIMANLRCKRSTCMPEAPASTVLRVGPMCLRYWQTATASAHVPSRDVIPGATLTQGTSTSTPAHCALLSRQTPARNSSCLSGMQFSSCGLAAIHRGASSQQLPDISANV